MSGSFFGLSIGRTGLFASQRALHVLGHNIANANTPGYSRQRVDLNATTPIDLPGAKGMIGTGVEASHIKNIRDEFLDFKYRGEVQAFGEWDIKSDVLMNIEVVMNEPTDEGIRSVMDDYFKSLEKLSTDPESLTTRSLVRESAIKLTKTINHMSNQLKDLQENLDFSVKTVVNQINGYADQIKNLNIQIASAELGGSNANDMRDERNLALDKLSELIEIDTFEDKRGRVNIVSGSVNLVTADEVSHLRVKKRGTVEKINNVDVDGLYEVVHGHGEGMKFNPTGGKLKGLIDVRDNIDGNDKGIPYYIDKLDHFAKTFAVHTNMIHREGYGLNGNKGVDFFEMGGMEIKDETTKVKDYMTANPKLSEEEAIRQLEKNGGIALGLPYEDISIVKIVEGDERKYYVCPKITASNMKISDEIEKDLNAIAASDTYAGLAGNGQNSKKMNQLKNNGDLFDWGKPEDFMKSLISNLGVDSQHAKSTTKNQMVLTDQINIQRQSVSGVSLDEEMTNMIKFQQAYNANARVITAVDEMIDVIVNRMGLVGR